MPSESLPFSFYLVLPHTTPEAASKIRARVEKHQLVCGKRITINLLLAYCFFETDAEILESYRQVFKKPVYVIDLFPSPSRWANGKLQNPKTAKCRKPELFTLVFTDEVAFTNMKVFKHRIHTVLL